MDRRTSRGKWKQLNLLRQSINQPPLINLNTSKSTWKWLSIFYLVVSSDLFNLSIYYSTHIKKQYYTQQKYDQQYHSQYHCQDTPLDRKRSRLLNNYQNDATPLLQCGNPSDTTRRSTPQSHRRYYEANAIHNPHENGVVKPPDPGV